MKRNSVLALLLLSAFAQPRTAQSSREPTITIGIGDEPDLLSARSPVLGPYLAAIRAEIEDAEALGREFDQEIADCKRQNAGLVARGLKARDCDEELAPIDPIRIDEPAVALTAAFVYRDPKTTFQAPGITMLRLRYGLGLPGSEVVREITIDLGPTFGDEPDVVRGFEGVRSKAEKLAAAIDGSGLPRYRDHGQGVRRLANEIFPLSALKRHLEEAQLTEALRLRCGGSGPYLLGAWADDRIYALLMLAAQEDGKVLGANARTDRGLRLRLVVADNALVGGTFRPVDNWDHALPLVPPMEWSGVSPVAEPMVMVVRSEEEWNRLWQMIGKPAPCVSFRDSFAVAVFLGPKPTIGYSVEWTTPPAETYSVVSYRIKESRAASKGTFQIYGVRRFPYAGGEIKVELSR